MSEIAIEEKKNRTERDGTGRNGTERDGTGRNGTERDGMGWNGMERDGTGRNGTRNGIIGTGLGFKIPLITIHEWQT
jgi:hypothetical protein